MFASGLKISQRRSSRGNKCNVVIETRVMGKPHQSRRALRASCMLLGFIAISSLTLAVTSDHWMYTKEPLRLPDSQLKAMVDAMNPGPMPALGTASVGAGDDKTLSSAVDFTKLAIPRGFIVQYHAGLWKVCESAPPEQYQHPEIEPVEMESNNVSPGSPQDYPPVEPMVISDEDEQLIDDEILYDTGLNSSDIADEEITKRPKCHFIDYHSTWQRVKGSDTTFSILRAMRKATFAIVASLAFLVGGLLVTTIGNLRQNYLALIGSVLLIITGLLLMLGLILYVCAVNDEIGHRKKPPKGSIDPVFEYNYGWSFGFACVALLTTNMAAVANIYFYQDEYTSRAEDFVQLMPETADVKTPDKNGSTLKLNEPPTLGPIMIV